MKKLPWLVPALLSLLLPLHAPAAPGALDRSFGGDGKVTSGFQPHWPGGFGSTFLATTPSGKIVVADGRALFQFLPDGSPDPRFGTGGRTEITPPDGAQYLEDLAVDSKGRILIAGTTETSSTSTSALVMRYRPDGALDPAFGEGGRVVTDFDFPLPTEQPEPHAPGDPPPTLPIVTARGIAVDAVDRPVVTGSWISARRDCYLYSYVGRGTGFVARLGVDGSTDGSSVATEPAGEVEFSPIIEGSELFAIAGLATCLRPADSRPTLIEYNEDLRPAETFGSDGRVALPYWDFPASVQDRFGRILLLGDAEEGGQDQFRLLRLTRNGSPDPRFGGENGRLLSLNIGPDLAVDARARAVIATQAGSPRNGWSFVITRRRSDGRLDRSFGRRGWVKTRFPGSALPFAIEVDERGRILVAGSMTKGKAHSVALARYLSR